MVLNVFFEIIYVGMNFSYFLTFYYSWYSSNDANSYPCSLACFMICANKLVFVLEFPCNNIISPE